MNKILLIGMGKFGQILGEKLLEVGDEVMIVDRDEEKINRFASKYADALIANCMEEENLRAMAPASFDACVVAIADDFQSSLEITSLLKELGAKYVVAKASTEIQRKFLLRNGADEVVYPDYDMAEKLAVTLHSTKVFDYVELNEETSIMEVAVPTRWAGKRLADVNPRKNHGLNLLTVRKSNEALVTELNADYVFKTGDHMLVFGNTEKILKFTNKLS